MGYLELSTIWWLQSPEKYHLMGKEIELFHAFMAKWTYASPLYFRVQISQGTTQKMLKDTEPILASC